MLRRRLDDAYEKGRTDALTHRPPDPSWMDKYERWAYQAGFREARHYPIYTDAS